MAAVFHLQRDAACTLAQLRTALEQEIDAEPVTGIVRSLPGAEVLLLSFERYYFRNGSYAGLQILLCRSADRCTADVIGSSGGAGLLNWSLGANEELAQDAVEILEKRGFAQCED